MDQEELFRRLAVALAIGLLIGLERGWRTREERDHQRTAGLRTFALTGLLGGICGLLSMASSPLVLGAGLLAYTAALVTFSYLEAAAEKNFSVTSVVAGILTFSLGAYATLGNETVAVGAGVAMAILLALREPLHSWVRTVTWSEIRSVLVLLAMSFLLLPVLPNRPVDPWQVLNPAEIWLLAILIAAISFAGYVAVRVLGQRNGIAVAAIAGGLASSTATTLSFARLSREHPESTRLLGGGILLAGVIMLVRILVLVGVLKYELLALLFWPVAAAACVLFSERCHAAMDEGDAIGRAAAVADQQPVRADDGAFARCPDRAHLAGRQAGGGIDRQCGAVRPGRDLWHRRCRRIDPVHGATRRASGRRRRCGQRHSHSSRSSTRCPRPAWPASSAEPTSDASSGLPALWRLAPWRLRCLCMGSDPSLRCKDRVSSRARCTGPVLRRAHGRSIRGRPTWPPLDQGNVPGMDISAPYDLHTSNMV